MDHPCTSPMFKGMITGRVIGCGICAGCKSICSTCQGLGYEVHRYGPDDNVEQLMCKACDGTGRHAEEVTS